MTDTPTNAPHPDQVAQLVARLTAWNDKARPGWEFPLSTGDVYMILRALAARSPAPAQEECPRCSGTGSEDFMVECSLCFGARAAPAPAQEPDRNSHEYYDHHAAPAAVSVPFQHGETGRITEIPAEQAAEFERLNARTWARVPSLPAAVSDSERVRAALVDVLALLDEGYLVRDTKDDDKPGWALRQMPYVMRLAAAAKVAYPSDEGSSP